MEVNEHMRVIYAEEASGYNEDTYEKVCYVFILREWGNGLGEPYTEGSILSQCPTICGTLMDTMN